MTTSIEWVKNEDGTQGKTWNPVTGCDKISPGCSSCYAATMAKRLKAMGSAKYQNDGNPETSGPGFGVAMHARSLTEPRATKKPTTYFVNSMSDLFHKEVTEGFIGSVFAEMGSCERHTFQVLTKRPQRMAKVLKGWEENGPGAYGGPIWRDHEMRWNELPTWPLPNAWLGTSIELDKYTFRANHLRDTPAAIRFLSLEPLLGPLPSLDLTDIDWVIVGGESGPSGRPLHPDWVRDIRTRCNLLGIPFTFKQWGAFTPDEPDSPLDRRTQLINGQGEFITEHEEGDCHVWRVGKKKAGRELDGRTWDEMPERVTS